MKPLQRNIPTWQLAPLTFGRSSNKPDFKPTAHRNRNLPRDQLLLSIVNGNNCFKTSKQVGKPEHLTRLSPGCNKFWIPGKRCSQPYPWGSVSTSNAEKVASLLCLIPVPWRCQHARTESSMHRVTSPSSPHSADQLSIFYGLAVHPTRPIQSPASSGQWTEWGWLQHVVVVVVFRGELGTSLAWRMGDPQTLR